MQLNGDAYLSSNEEAEEDSFFAGTDVGMLLCDDDHLIHIMN